MLTIERLNQYYGGSHTLRDVSLEVPSGKVTALLGRNGMGKTTLLRCLMGLLPARSGRLQLDRIEQTLVQVHLLDATWRMAGILSHGQKQWLEIGMLLVQQPRLILLDEPVAGMTDAETERTAELCLSLEGSHSIVVVEHDMEFVSRIARKVTVLHEGSVLAEGSMASVRNDERVIEVYLGR